MEQSIVKTLNSQTRNMQIDAQVITLDDNLFHPYFTSVDIAKDNLSPIGIAKGVTVYSEQVLKYWTNYIGTVIMSFNIKELKHINTNSAEYTDAHDLPQRVQNDQYNYSLICKVSKVKPKGQKITIYFEDLGWKFLQKVPQEFRNTYIAGQPLDQAFQAMCEFLGVEFAYSIEDLKEYNFGADGYSIEKEGQVIETVETVLSEWKSPEEQEEEENPLDSEDNTNPSLLEYDNKNKNNDDYERNEKNKNTKVKEQTEEEVQKDKYQAEFDDKILNLFIGNTYYESDLTSNVMSYDKITVTPTSTTDNSNSDGSMSSEDTDNNTDQNSGQSISQNLLNKGKSGITLKGVTFTKASLSYDQVNNMTPDQAYHESLRTNYYYHTTILRLRARAYLKHNIDASTDYTRFNH